MTIRVRKAVFPVAGLGTRFLPATKALAKEMLPVIDKPLIQYAVEEAVAAGIEQLVFVTGHTKKAIEDHFDRSAELESVLEAKGKTDLLARVRDILPSRVTCIYIRQPAPLGLGHAVLCARPAVGGEPFAILLPDDLIDSDGPGCTAQMVRRFESTGHGLVAVQPVPREETGRYGIVSLASPAEEWGGRSTASWRSRPPNALHRRWASWVVTCCPRRSSMPSKTPRAGSGGEIQLTDAIAALLDRETISAFPFEGIRYDCGAKEGFLAANVGLALKRPELRSILREFSNRI